MRDNDILRDIADRVRRFETKLTRFMAAAGFETGGRKPELIGGPLAPEILVPNAAVSVADCVATIPDEYAEDSVPVVHNGEVLGYVSRP